MSRLKLKSETTIRRYRKELEAVVRSDDIVASRLAYFAINAIRRVTEDVKGWPPLTDDARLLLSFGRIDSVAEGFDQRGPFYQIDFRLA